MSLIGLFKGTGHSGFGYDSTAEDVTEGLDLTGKAIFITGCSSGIGKETMRVLAMRGARVYGAARSLEKAAAACRDIEGDGVPVACDLDEPVSVRGCIETMAKAGDALDAIIGNAGIMALPRLTLQHGYEKQFYTNHIGHFQLVTGLVDLLSETGRVVMVSSYGHNLAPKEGIQFDNLDGSKAYKPIKNYGQSKLANILFANELAVRFQGSGRTANSLHPGTIRTKLVRHMPSLADVGMKVSGQLLFKTIPQGAATSCYVAVHPQLADVSGEYFADSNIHKRSKHARNVEMAERLWAESEKIVAALPD